MSRVMTGRAVTGKLVQGADGLWREVIELTPEEKRKEQAIEERRARRAAREAVTEEFTQTVLDRFAGARNGGHWFTHGTEGFCDSTFFAVEMKSRFSLSLSLASVVRKVDGVLLQSGIRLREEFTKGPYTHTGGEAALAKGRYRKEL